MAILLGIYINLFDASEQNGPYFEDHMIKRNFLKIYWSEMPLMCPLSIEMTVSHNSFEE